MIQEGVAKAEILRFGLKPIRAGLFRAETIMKSRSFGLALFVVCSLGLVTGNALRSYDPDSTMTDSQPPTIRQTDFEAPPIAPSLSLNNKGVGSQLAPVSLNDTFLEVDDSLPYPTNIPSQDKPSRVGAMVEVVGVDKVAAQVQTYAGLTREHQPQLAPVLKTAASTGGVTRQPQVQLKRPHVTSKDNMATVVTLTPEAQARASGIDVALEPLPAEEIIVRASRPTKVRTIDDLERGTRGNTVNIPLPKSG